MTSNSDSIDFWWQADPAENYWIESTNRQDLGVNLLAPVSGQAGQKLVAQVRDEDIVLHYYQPMQAIVAFSVARGSVIYSEIRWPDRKHSEIQPAYEFSLSNFTELDQPIRLEQIQESFFELKAIRDSLLEKHGTPLYLPFSFRSDDTLRPSQGAYLSKLPIEMLKLLPNVNFDIQNSIPLETFESNHVIQTKLKQPDLQKQSKGSGYQSDPKKKLAVEKYAMKRATEYLESLGYTATDVSAQKNIGYDIRGEKQAEIVGVEVKGSLSKRFAVDITVNELEYARQRELDGPYRTLLFLVDCVELENRDDELVGVSGEVRFWWDWNPDPEALFSTSFRYTLPT